MKIKICFFITCLVSSLSIHSFSYDSAIYAAQKGDIKSADEQLRNIVVNSPDDPDVLYDAGVLAYQLNNHSQAAAYFNRSAQCADDQDKNLCFRAHFNAGNAYVDTKDLRLALEHYDEALAIDPHNEYARHNRDRVAQMLQEQEQQKKENQQDQKDQRDDKDQQDKDDQNQDDQSGDKNDQQKNNDQQHEDDQQQNNDSQKNGSNKESQGKQGKGSDQDSKREQGAEQGDADKDQHNSSNDKERNCEQKFDKKSKRAQNEREKQQGKQHEKAPQEQNKTKSENSIPSQDKQEQGKSEASASAKSKSEMSSALADASSDELAKDDALDPWLAGILNDQEVHDKAVNKKLMEARIRQHGGKNGQNCW